MSLDYYKVLGVSRNATDAEVKKQYRSLARKYHPDVSKLKNAEKRFKEINEAYEVLKNKKKRSNYDRFGSADANPFGAGGGGFNPPPNGSQSDFGGFGQGSFSDIFDNMFSHGGGSSRQANAGFNQQPNFNSGSRRQAQADVQTIDVEISLEDTYHGAEKSFRLSLPGQKEPKRLKVKIPKGIKEGQKIRLNKQGNHGADLFLKIKYKVHHSYKLDGNDVHINFPISVWEAALGAQLSIPTLGGEVSVKIPAGSQSGKKLRLKNRGLGKTPGNQYVTLMIKIDPSADDKIQNLYKEMKEQSSFNPRENT